MEKLFRVFVVVALVSFMSFFAVGCAKKKVVSEPEVSSTRTTGTVEDQGTAARGIYETGMAAESESLDTEAQVEEEIYPVLEGRSSGPLLPIYFDFDKSDIREDQRDRIEGNSQFLTENSSMRVRIEGNCDERGTNEYNMALGQRRALSAQKYLVNLGISANRLETISYGEEKPLLFGHDEFSWAQNRRDDFVVVR
jgi:peptidoglycan-associated lipoprotein